MYEENNIKHFPSMDKLKIFLKKYRAPLLSALLGMGIFLLLFGPAVLDPAYTDWYASGDPGGHYFGWKLFREADWQVMVGMMNTANYPYSASVVFTDSIPVAAIIFKLFRSLEPADFQYFGLWGFMCFALQGALSAIILKKYIKNDLSVIISSVFFILAPAFVRRMFWHTALASHWLILLGLVFFVWHFEKFDTPKRSIIAWGLLGALCPLIHSYYLIFCGLIAFVFALEDFWKNKSPVRFLLPLLSFSGAALVTMYFLGALSSYMNVDAPGLGYYSFNLNSFFDSDGWSIVLPKLDRYTDGQFEGFAYLGGGILILLILALIYTVVTRDLLHTRPSKKTVLASILGLASIFLALSDEISFNSRLLIDLKVPEGGLIHKAWQTFRSTGRIAWVAMYLLMIYSIVSAVRGWGNDTWTGTLIAAIFLALQLIDLSPGLIERRFDVISMGNSNKEKYVLNDSLWAAIAESGKYTHLTFHNKEKLSQDALYAFADYASDNGMTINDYYFARAYDLKVNQRADELARRPQEGYFFIFHPSEEVNFIDYPLEYYNADGFIVGIPAEH